MLINRVAIDIYALSQVHDWAAIKAAGVQLVIHKASEGETWRDGAYAARRQEATAHGLLWAAYHFGNGRPVETQVKNFLEAAKIDDATRPILDWEQSSMTPAMAREFLQRVGDATGQLPVLYSYSSFLAGQLGPKADPVLGHYPLWIAAYADRQPVLQASWSSFLLWQYTDGSAGPGPHTVPGVDGGLDCNHSPLSADEFRAAWQGPRDWTVPSSPQPPLPEAGTVARVQALLAERGHDPGAADGKRGPKTNAALADYAFEVLSKEIQL